MEIDWAIESVHIKESVRPPIIHFYPFCLDGEWPYQAHITRLSRRKSSKLRVFGVCLKVMLHETIRNDDF